MLDGSFDKWELNQTALSEQALKGVFENVVTSDYFPPPKILNF